MPRSAKNPLLKQSATHNECNFRVDFYAEDAIRLSPYKDDKCKYAENTPFWAGSDYSRLPTDELPPQIGCGVMQCSAFGHDPTGFFNKL